MFNLRINPIAYPLNHPPDHMYKVRSSTSPANSGTARGEKRTSNRRPPPDSPPHFPPELPYPPNLPTIDPFYENTNSVRDHDLPIPNNSLPSSHASHEQPIQLSVSPKIRNPDPHKQPSPQSTEAIINYNPPISPNLSPHLPLHQNHNSEDDHSQSSPVEEPLPHWSSTNTKRARFHTVCPCPACHLEVKVGDRISYQFQYRRFVHEYCASNHRASPR